jgi:feruloyl esterase
MAPVVVAVVILSQPVPAIAATACEDIASLALPNAKIDQARAVAAGTFTPPAGQAPNVYADLPAFCRVSATLTPSRDSDIKIEVWLPAAGWNGKFQAVGNGGWAGVIPYPALAAAVASGYAGAGTDTGHVGNNAEFAPGHPEKMVDLAYRSIHEMTVQSKTLIHAYYDTAPRFSYYNGCSQGGRQGLASAQRYPQDFDGIVVGAPAWNAARNHAARTALNLIVNKNPDSVIPASKYSMIHAAVLHACDAQDGVKDGVIENPTTCGFAYASLACRGSDGPDCLTPGQVESANAMTSPIKDPKTGTLLYEGHLWPGSELGWGTLGGPKPLGNALTAMTHVVFNDRNWDYHTMNLATDVDLAVTIDNGLMYTGDPNLAPFFDRGGKLLMYHGWADPQVTPQNATTYYNNVVTAVGTDKASKSIALFMVPGMNHCRGGAGTDTFDKMKVLEEWVERGETPTRIIASHRTDGHVDKTRPLCPFGQVARYSGRGDASDATNFSCVDELMSTTGR